MDAVTALTEAPTAFTWNLVDDPGNTAERALQLAKPHIVPEADVTITSALLPHGHGRFCTCRTFVLQALDRYR